VIFKGTGFYKTDTRKEDVPAAKKPCGAKKDKKESAEPKYEIPSSSSEN
jgi:predicted nucleic acid-binding Zn ribbon protein